MMYARHRQHDDRGDRGNGQHQLAAVLPADQHEPHQEPQHDRLKRVKADAAHAEHARAQQRHHAAERQDGPQDERQTFATLEQALAPKLPLTVLVDRFSASAADPFALWSAPPTFIVALGLAPSWA